MPAEVKTTGTGLRAGPTTRKIRLCGGCGHKNPVPHGLAGHSQCGKCGRQAR